MQTRTKNLAMVILLSFGVAACHGGSSQKANSSDLNATNAKLVQQEQQLKKQADEVNALKAKLAKAEAAYEEASKQSGTKNEVSAEEFAKLKADYEATKKAYEATANKLATQEKAEAERLAKAEEERKKWEAEEAKRQAEAEAERKKWEAEEAKRQAEAEAERKKWEEEEAKRQAEQAKRDAETKVDNYNGDAKYWRFHDLNAYYPDAYHQNRANMGFSILGNNEKFEVPSNYYEYPVSNEIHRIPVTSTKEVLQNGVLTTVTEPAGEMRFVNQQYSTYANWTPEKGTLHNYVNGAQGEAGYVALPTLAENANVTEKGIVATYKGKALIGVAEDRSYGSELGYVNQYKANNETADFGLTANFDKNTVEGKINNRTSGESDITLVQGNINLDWNNGQRVLTFKGELSSNGVNGSGYSGHFAGPNAEEVVGSGDHYDYTTNKFQKISFGGTRQ